MLPPPGGPLPPRCSADTNLDAALKPAAREVKKSCNLNLAAAYLKLGKNKKAIKAATKVTAT